MGGFRQTNWLLRIVLTAGLLVLLVTYWTREKLPDPGEIVADLWTDPVQEAVPEGCLEVAKGRLTATLFPHFRYAVAGLVASYYDSDVWHDYTHQNDPFNTKDLCLIWGGNVRSDIFHQVEFSHGEFSCACRYPAALSGRFDLTRFANNHIIPATAPIAERLREIRSGDQVRITGLLVDYRIRTPAGMYSRNTSTVRNDAGCEIIYADSLVVLKRGNPLSAALHEASFWLVLICLAVMVFRFIASAVRGTIRRHSASV